MWKMLHEANAIEAMAVNIRFLEPVSNMIVKRMIREVERHASKLGLIDRQPIQGFQIDVMNPGQVKPLQSSGLLLQRKSLTKIPSGAVENQLAQQVDVQATHITYQTWRYSRWANELDMISQLIFGAIETASQAVTISAIRVEYIDRFIFEGDPKALSFSSLLRNDSGWIAPQVLKSNSLWHSHAGEFLSEGDDMKRLGVVHIDSQELSGPPHLAGRRSLMMITGVEDQFLQSGLEIDSDKLRQFLPDTLNDLHSNALDLFRNVIDQEFAAKNGLPS